MAVENYIETVRRVMEGGYDDATQEERDRAVREIIQLCAASAAAVTVQPLPFVDIALISPIQIAMVQAISRIYGHRLDKKAILEMLSTFGASLVAQNVAMAAAKFVPFLGWLVTISMAFALTYAIGEVCDHYFRNGRGVPSEELKEMFERVYKTKRAEKQQEHKKNESLKDRLEQLKEAYREGLLTEEEFEHKKQELLKSF